MRTWMHGWRLVAVALLTGSVGAWTAPVGRAQEAPEDPNAKVFRPHQEPIQVRCPNCVFDEEKGRSSDQPAPRAVVRFDPGTPCPICVGNGFMATTIDWQAGVYQAEGFGVPPKDLERDYRDATSDKERERILLKARVQAARAATLDAWRNAMLLAARVRMDGSQRLGASRVEHLTAELVGMETVAGEWVTQYARPFFKLTVRIPMWGVKGLVANLLEDARKGATQLRGTRAHFDWRTAGGDKPGDKPGDQPGDQPGDKPGDQPGDKPGDQPGDQPGDKPGDTPGDKPGDEEQVHAPEKSADKIVGIIIDAREVKKDKGPVNAALFPTVVTPKAPAEGEEPPAEPQFETVHDVADTDPQASSSRGVVSYVESDTPFERIAALYGKRGWLVVRLGDLESEQLAGWLPSWFPQVKFGGGGKKKLTFKVKAENMEGAERANVVISAQDAKKLQETNAATNALKNCKVIVIAGGDIAGKRGALPGADGVRTAGR